MMTSRPDSERRIEQLEFIVLKLQGEIKQIRGIATQAQEDADRMQFPSSKEEGDICFQVVASTTYPTGFTAASGAILGAGTGRVQVVIAGKRYNLTDGTAGHYTDVTISNDVFSTIPLKTYGLARVVNGILRIWVGTCTPSATYSADDITA